jgi:hypothetical protein
MAGNYADDAQVRLAAFCLHATRPRARTQRNSFSSGTSARGSSGRIAVEETRWRSDRAPIGVSATAARLGTRRRSIATRGIARHGRPPRRFRTRGGGELPRPRAAARKPPTRDRMALAFLVVVAFARLRTPSNDD